MDKELFELKKKVVSVISDKTYYGLINFVEKIYNADYDVVILMARKASNLYAALLPLAKEEYLGSIQEKHEKMGDCAAEVISDRAIERVLSDIKRCREKTKYKRILVADDIIIHGTTMALIREKLRAAYAEAGVSEKDFQIDIMAYAENMDGIALNSADICNSDVILRCNTGSWKKISNRIIDVLHIMGRPYTSYVPHAEIRMESPLGERIKAFIREGNIEEIIDRNMCRRNVKTYVVTQEHKSGYAICETYRIYEYSKLGKYIFVPMVTIHPVNETMLDHYMEELFVYVTDGGKKKIEEIAEALESEYLYRVAVYILSALSGWNFFVKILGWNAEECKYDAEEEMMNFSCRFLCRFAELDEKATIDGTLKNLDEIYDSLKAGMVCLDDCSIGDDVGQLENEVDEIIDYASDKRGMGRQEVSDNIVAKILETNNRLDEDKFTDWETKSQDKIRRRMKGVSVASMYRKLGRINGGIVKNSKAIVHAIDTGKGSIVPFSIVYGNQRLFISMIRAGEQNYRYYVDNYLPIMYGFCMIETGGKNLTENKEILWDQYYEESEMPFFAEKDKEYLINGVSMDREFGDVITEEVLRENNSEIEKINKIIHSQMIG